MSGFNYLRDLWLNVKTCPNPPATVRQIAAYGLVNQWLDLDVDEIDEMCDAIVAAGMNCTHIEVLGYAERGYADRLDDVERRLRVFWDTVRVRNLHMIATLVNWNMGAGLPQNGRKSICHADYNDAWFGRLLDMVADLPEADRLIWCSPCSELGGRNAQCTAKGEHWCRQTQQRWPNGRVLWNKGSRPNTVPAGWLREYHSARSSDCPTDALAVSDTSSILQEWGGLTNWLRRPEACAAWVRGCRARRSGVSYYDFGNPEARPDFEAIRVMGAAWRG